SLTVVGSEGWAQTDDATLAAFERLLQAVAAAGVTILRRSDRADLEAFEREIAESLLLCRDICGWELRWTLRNLAHKDVGKLSASMRTRLELAEAMSVDDYRAALSKREAMRSRFR